MRKFNVLILFFLVLKLSVFHAQQIEFEKKIGRATTADWGYSAVETFDGGYVAAGLTGAIGFGQEDVYLVKTNDRGDTLWTKTYGTPSNGEFAKAVVQTRDSGYAVLGYTESYGAGAADVYLIKTDVNGDTLWTKTYGGAGNDDGASIQETEDGGFIIVGNSRSFGAGEWDVYLIKTDSKGDTLWTKTYGDQYNAEAASVQKTSDKGYVIVGNTYGFKADYMDVYLIKVDSLGNLQWQKTYDGPENGNESGDFGTAVQQTQDGGYVITGGKGAVFTESFKGQTWLLKTNSIGDTLWTKYFGKINEDDSRGNDVKQCADGGYVLAGTRYTNETSLDVFLVRTNAVGDTLWTKTIGSREGNAEKGLSINVNKDGSYIVSGYAYEKDNWHQVYLIKMLDFTPVSVVENYANSTFTVYPNPTTGNFTLNLGERYDQVDIVVTDVTGRIVLSGTYNAINQLSIPLREPKGFYFLSIETESFKDIVRLVKE